MDKQELDRLKREKGTNNPLGKGGFGDHPEHINLKGQPRRPEIEIFKEALMKLKDEYGVDILEHAVARSYKNDNVLIALMRKMVPDLSAIESTNFTLEDMAKLIAGEPNKEMENVIDAESVEEETKE